MNQASPVAGLFESTWFVVPAYNEAKALPGTLREIRTVCPNMIVVDDGSADDTAAVAREHGAVVARHIVNLGQGAALATGLQVALELGAQHIVTFDADGQHDVHDVPPMLERLVDSGAELALGSRFLGSTLDMPASRRILLKAAVAFTRMSSGVRLTDAHNGLRVFSRAAAARLRIRQDRMAHASELIDQIGKQRIRYVEVPVRVRYTAYSLAKGQRTLDSVLILKDLIAERIAR